MSTIAKDGWKRTRDLPFEPQDGPSMRRSIFSPDGVNSYIRSIEKVLESEILSGYRGNSTQAFWGGKFVKKFESEVETFFRAKHAISCNSATAGLWMACAAIDLKPGDEVIVSPWSMSCSASVPLLFGAIPIFADINSETYCLDYDDVFDKITKRTKAIIAVDLFGFPFDERISELAKRLGIVIIEDAAQAIGATRNGKYAGTLGDIGVFSFTQGKHLTAGEGGCCLTDNDFLAARLALARNHAEAVSSDLDSSNKDEDDSIFYQDNMVGLNLRMTEIQAAILSIELSRLSRRILSRISIADEIISKFKDVFGCVSDYPQKEGYTNALYCLPIRFADNSRTLEIVETIKSELVGDRVRIDRGVPISNGYVRPLYKMPVFRYMRHWAFWLEKNIGSVQNYIEMNLPNAEKLNSRGLIITLLHSLELNEHDICDIKKAIEKAGGKDE